LPPNDGPLMTADPKKAPQRNQIEEWLRIYSGALVFFFWPKFGTCPSYLIRVNVMILAQCIATLLLHYLSYPWNCLLTN